MAYGKDPKALGNAGSFRSSANRYQHQREQNRESRSSGGGGGVYWATQFKPSLTEMETIRVIEGHFKVPQVIGSGKEASLEMIDLPFFPWAEHFDGYTEKTAVCSAGPFAGSKSKADPCEGCAMFWSNTEKDHNGKRKQGRMSRREMYAFSILDYGIYHNVEQIDFKTGQVRINDQTGQPWMSWEKCEGQGCSACRAGKESRRGSTRHWSLGWGHYSTLLDADTQIGRNCSNCRGLNTINSIAWTCPGCGDAVVDMSTTSMKMKEIEELVRKPIQCKCTYQGMAIELIECRSCTGAGGTAKRASIFDVDMNVKRVKSSDGNQTSLSISQWSQPGPVDPTFKDFFKALDLPKIYKPTTLEKQRELFEIKNSTIQRTPVTAGDAARPYGQQQQLPPPPQMQPAPMVNPYAAPQGAGGWVAPPGTNPQFVPAIGAGGGGGVGATPAPTNPFGLPPPPDSQK